MIGVEWIAGLQTDDGPMAASAGFYMTMSTCCQARLMLFRCSTFFERSGGESRSSRTGAGPGARL